MSKLEKLRQSGLGNAAESMGVGVPGRVAPGSALHGATALGPAALPAHLQGVARNKDAAVIPSDRIGPDPTQPREEFGEDELREARRVAQDPRAAPADHGLLGRGPWALRNRLRREALEGRQTGRDPHHDRHHPDPCPRGR